MYGLRLDLQASAALTMRVLPSGILDIITYPFVPPTTFSGWLRRVWMLAAGLDLPPTSAAKDAPYYVLPQKMISLGAYPKRTSFIHKTKRKGVKDFKDTSFTRLIFNRDTGPTFQLHSWEYLTTDTLEAYVMSETSESLERLRQALLEEEHTLPWGCKLGKEGFAYLQEVSEVLPLQQETGLRKASTLVPLETVVQQATPVDFAVHNIYRFVYGESDTTLEAPSPIQGYSLLSLAFTTVPLETSWWIHEEMQVPVGLETALGGRRDV